MKAIHKRRLLKLAKFLREKVAPSGKYVQDIWMGKDKKGHRHKRASLKCGTPACALGWATAIFPLHVNQYGSISETAKAHSNVYQTVQEFFGVNEEDFIDSNLFLSTEHRTAKQEAKLIERYVARQK